uniref:Uncharacterized protein n=1 Tax=Triticum urartu TaxID=4572 RepID=A0A8R7PME6_TRIUA
WIPVYYSFRPYNQMVVCQFYKILWICSICGMYLGPFTPM